MSRVLRAAMVVCAVCAATELNADVDLLEGALHHWQASDDVKTAYKEDQTYGNESAKVSMDGIEKAVRVAVGLIRLEEHTEPSDDVIHRIEQFTTDGHRQYNRDGNPHSQNFVVMVIKLVEMIADDYAIKTACGNALNVNAAGGGASDAWWTCGKNKDHDPIADCDLYIDNFKVREYIGELKGALMYMTNPDRKDRNNLNEGGPDLETTKGNSYIAAAYQVMARLPNCQKEAIETLKAIRNRIELEKVTPAASKSADEVENAQNHLKRLNRSLMAVQACLIGTSAIAYDKAETVTTHLVTQIVHSLEDAAGRGKGAPHDVLERTALCFNDGHDVWANLRTQLKSKFVDGKTMMNIGTGDLEELNLEHSRLLNDDNMFSHSIRSWGLMVPEQLNAGHPGEGDTRRVRECLPLRLGKHPEIRIVDGHGGLGRIRSNENAVERVALKLRNALESKYVTKKFSWGKNGWQDLDGDEKDAVRIYKLKSAVIRTKWNGVNEYLTMHWDDDLGSYFIKGKGWMDAFRLAVTKKDLKYHNLGDVVDLYYWNHDSRS